MAEKRKKPDDFEIDLGMGNLFKGLGNLFELVSELVDKGEEAAGKVKEFKGEGKLKDLHGVYGFSIRTALGGKTRIEPFGNIKRTKKGPVVEDVIEPIVDLFDEGDAVQIVCELPGVEEGNIEVEIKGDVVAIIAEGKKRKYQKEVLLPSRVRPDSKVTSYKNGILEINLKKDSE